MPAPWSVRRTFLPRACTAGRYGTEKSTLCDFVRGGGLQNNKVLSFPCLIYQPEAEFEEFESRLKFETHLKYCWFRLKLYTMFQDLGRRSIETGFWLYLAQILKIRTHFNLDEK